MQAADDKENVTCWSWKF